MGAWMLAHLHYFTIVYVGNPFFFPFLFGNSKISESFCVCEPEHPRDVFSVFIFEFPLTDFCFCEQQTLLDKKP